MTSRDRDLQLSKLTDDSFGPGRRDFLQVRDLKASDLSDGAVGAIVVRAKEGIHEATDWHYHKCDWQMIYMLQGWAEMEFTGGDEIEPVKIEAGDFYLLRGGAVHREVATSDDMTALELMIPSTYESVTVEAPATAEARRR
jgi:quercetin dioxygenase-like cupin family protein